MAASAAFGAPAIWTARRAEAADPRDLVIGKGDYQFRVDHKYLQLPDKYYW